MLIGSYKWEIKRKKKETNIEKSQLVGGWPACHLQGEEEPNSGLPDTNQSVISRQKDSNPGLPDYKSTPFPTLPVFKLHLVPEIWLFWVWWEQKQQQQQEQLYLYPTYYN